MKILRLSIVLALLCPAYAHTTELDSIRLGSSLVNSCRSETDIYAREGSFDDDEEKLHRKIQTETNSDPSGNHKKSTSIIADCHAFSGNALAYLCSPRVLCTTFCCALAIYCISIPFIYGINYCHQTFSGVDRHCINLGCLEKRNLLESYSLCLESRICWRERHKLYDVCLNDECVYAEGYCENTMAVAFTFVMMPVIFCLRSCMRYDPHASEY
jgi:hypothetical protein